MKIAKKLVLTYLAWYADQYHSYETLYGVLAYQPSTIRGIIQEFLEAGLIRRRTIGAVRDFCITSRGLREAQALAPRLFSAAHKMTQVSTAVVLEPTDATSLRLTRAGYAALDRHLWICTRARERKEDLAMSLRGEVLFYLSPIGGEQALVEALEETREMRHLIRRREIVSTQLGRLLQRSHRHQRMIGAHAQSWRELGTTLLRESAAVSPIPEIYLQKEMRIIYLFTLLWPK